VGWRARGALVVALGAVVALGVVLVAWAAEDTEPHWVAVARDAPRRTRSTTTAPTTTMPPATLAPAPASAAPPPEEPPSEEAPMPPPRSVSNAASPPPEPDPEPSPPAASCATGGGGSFVELHRRIRCDNGIGDIGLDGDMRRNAQLSAERLAHSNACDALFHSPELGAWYAGTWAENLACVYSSSGCLNDPAAVMEGWMASGTHRANILNSSYHWLGVGVACDGSHSSFVVHFRG
jgi:uncharacterized protein YkwD